MIEQRIGTLNNIQTALANIATKMGHDAGNPNKASLKPKDLIPGVWSGDRDRVTFPEYHFQLKNYMMAAFKSGTKMMDAVESMEEYDALDLVHHVEQGEDLDVIERDLYTVLSKTTSGQSNAIIRNSKRGDGFEAWFQLLRRYDPKNSLDKNAAYAQVASPPKRAMTTDQLKDMLTNWSVHVTHYESRFGALPEETKINAMKQMMPMPLLENRYRGVINLKYDTLKKELENYINDKAQGTTQSNGRKTEDNPTPMEIDMVKDDDPSQLEAGTAWDGNIPPGLAELCAVYYNGKGGWGKATGKGKEKGWTGGVGGVWSGKSGLGKGKSKGKGKGDGSAKGKGKASERTCWTCGKRGHLSFECPNWQSGPISMVEKENDELAEDDGHEPITMHFDDVPVWMLTDETEFKKWAKVHQLEEGCHACGDHEDHAKFAGANRFRCLARVEEEEDGDPELNAIEVKGDWIRIEATVDSGAAESVCPRNMFPKIIAKQDRAGKQYVAANGSKIADEGEKLVPAHTSAGKSITVKFRAASVVKPLMSVRRINQAGNVVVLDDKDPYIKCRKTGDITKLRCQNGVFVMDLWVNAQEAGPVFGRQGR